MKASNIGLWITGAAVVWFAWIFLDMSAPPPSGHRGSGSMSAIRNSTVPVLVEFSAGWCGACRSVAPVVDELSHELGGRAKIVRVDVDEEPAFAAQHGVRGLPTFIAYKNGREAKRQSGAIPKATMLQMLGL